MPLTAIPSTLPDDMEGFALVTAERDGDGHVVSVRVALSRSGDEESFLAEIRPADRPRITAWMAAHVAPNNLRMLRVRQGLTQRQVEERAGLPRTTLAHLEAGTRRPWLKTATALAVALGVRVDELGVEIYGAQ